MTLQEIILTLQNYWAERGCVVVPSYDVEKGAGTFNAATYLRSLGPEPWAAAYVEPSRRPTDGRYGENPNRVERHHQFQVIIKPSPIDIQEQYLGSLRAIGIDTTAHDVRFVEDNWESPTLGAWGLGWEVWFDGMEITQFTYFQQCGGYDLKPVAVEMTYGLERIAMSLQNVENVYDLQWNEQFTYGQIRLQEEIQWSKHNFEAADIELHLRWFRDNQEQCQRLADKGLVIPAYDYCLRCSHVFNILDARGAIGVTERQAYILRVRDLAKRCADEYLSHRESLGFPLVTRDANDADSGVDDRPAQATSASDDSEGAFLLEVGAEEIPARLAPGAAQQLLRMLQAEFKSWGLAVVEGGRWDSTPRRLVVSFDKISLRQADRDESIKGPPTRIAFDADGNRTRAGEAFYSKVEAGDEVVIEQAPKGDYLVIHRQVKGADVSALLADALPRLLGKIHWPKSMRWAYQSQAFVRPIQWLLAALGGSLIDFEFAGVTSGLTSRGHRFHAPDEFEATTREALEAELLDRQVMLSVNARRSAIEEGVRTLASESGGEAVLEAALLQEVTHIVEWPIPLLGRFEADLLDLPEEAIITPMKVHQRYFPVRGKDGALMPCFVVVAGTDVSEPGAVAHNNARVLRARLSDARFFYENDLRNPLESYLPKLETRIWLAKLGSVRDKSQRLVSIVERVSDSNDASRAAQLCKADLATDMVSEFPELQGTMGREYARKHGESVAVANAIFEHYLPRHATDDLPRGVEGTLVALADRFDSIVGCFGIGLKPTGSKDPYALRRQAIAVINILTETTRDIPRDLNIWLDATIASYGDLIEPGCRKGILEFFDDRTRYLFRETLPKDVVDAVVSTGVEQPHVIRQRIDALAELRDSGELEPVLTTFKRVANITKDVPKAEGFDRSALVLDVESALVDGFTALPEDDNQLFAQLGTLRPIVDAFFEGVLVMAENPDLRAARLGLLGSIRDRLSSVADFSRIQDRK